MPTYLSRDDLVMRLDSSVCFYKKKPYYMKQSGEDDFHRMLAYPLGDRNKQIIVDVRNEDFDVRSPTLGYMNSSGVAHYMSRVPDRRNKQGLHTGVLVSSVPGGTGKDYIMSCELRDMLVDKYPTQKKALANISTGIDEEGRDVQSIAFHKHFCFRRLADNVIGMLYKERLVAMYADDSERFNLIQSKETSFIERIMNRNGVAL